MRTFIFALVFLGLVAFLFITLFNQPINADTREIRAQMRTEQLFEKEEKFKKRFINRCIRKMYEEAEMYVDSIIASPSVNPVNELDSLKRPLRPSDRYDKDFDTQRVALEPLFEDVDSTRLEEDQ